jgi:hypothetical protein
MHLSNQHNWPEGMNKVGEGLRAKGSETEKEKQPTKHTSQVVFSPVPTQIQPCRPKKDPLLMDADLPRDILLTLPSLEALESIAVQLQGSSLDSGGPR